MLQIKLTNGEDLFLNSLTVLHVVRASDDSECEIHVASGKKYTVKGSAKDTAKTVHVALRSIYKDYRRD